jgi:3',5'-nucleoside bisphosphate phosphatase
MTVDFHVHSTASDGTFSPTELIEKAKDFTAIALTDHDNSDGVAEFVAAAAQQSVKAIAGIELSIEPGKGFDKFHLLGLGVDVGNAALKAFLKRVLDGRNERNDRILANFRKLGIEMLVSSVPDVPFVPVTAYAHGDVLARPHFARWLVDNGYATDNSDAFRKYLLPESPAETRCYEERYHPSQEETFRIIHGAGGICVMAHPRYWRRTWKHVGPDYLAAETELARLKEAGLDGLESIYEANTVDENLKFPKIAQKVGLLRSVGSDFHGANKPQISLGMEVTEDFIRPLLERLG